MLCFSIPTTGFPSFLLYFRCKLGVTFARRCFRDGKALQVQIFELYYSGFLSRVNLDDFIRSDILDFVTLMLKKVKHLAQSIAQYSVHQ